MLIGPTRGPIFMPTVLTVVHADRGDGRAMMPWRARAAGVPETRLLEQIEGLEPADCFGGRLVGHTEPHGDGAITQRKLSQVQRFSRNLLVGGQLGDLDKRHLEWRGRRGSNALRPGPPTASFVSALLQ